MEEMIRGWGSFCQLQLPKGPAVGNVSHTVLNFFTASQPVLPHSCPKRFLGVLGSESALKFFMEGMKNHDKLQECDLFLSLLSLFYSVF